MAERWVFFLPEPFPAAALGMLDALFQVREGRKGPAYTEEELAAPLDDVDALAIYSRDRVRARVLDAAPRLREVAKGAPSPPPTSTSRRHRPAASR